MCYHDICFALIKQLSLKSVTIYLLLCGETHSYFNVLIQISYD